MHSPDAKQEDQRDHQGPFRARNRPCGMKQKEAKTLITREWERWLSTQSIDAASATGRETLKFYFELQDSKSTLLDFQSRGRDKWHIINSWLLREQHCLSD
jgi:nuclear transport factor 2 (NTF2) superfamily protein